MFERNRTGIQEQVPDPKKKWLDNKAVLLGFIIFVQGLVAFGLTQYLILPRLGVNSANLGGMPTMEGEILDRGVLVDLEDDRFYDARGLRDEDLAPLRTGQPTLSDLTEVHGEAWVRFHGLRLCLLGLARLCG